MRRARLLLALDQQLYGHCGGVPAGGGEMGAHAEEVEGDLPLSSIAPRACSSGPSGPRPGSARTAGAPTARAGRPAGRRGGRRRARPARPRRPRATRRRRRARRPSARSRRSGSRCGAARRPATRRWRRRPGRTRGRRRSRGCAARRRGRRAGHRGGRGRSRARGCSRAPTRNAGLASTSCRTAAAGRRRRSDLRRTGRRARGRAAGPPVARVPADVGVLGVGDAVAAKAGLRTYAPDQLGYSPGARPGEVHAYSMQNLAQVTADLLTALDVPVADVVGHDWGANVAWTLAAWHSDRVRSLTAVSVPHPAAYTVGLPRRPGAEGALGLHPVVLAGGQGRGRAARRRRAATAADADRR